MQGNLDAALDSYRHSLAIRERLIALDANNLAWAHDLAVSYGMVGVVLGKQGKAQEALDALNAGRAIVARLKEQFPDNASLAQDLAWFDAEIAKLKPPAPPAQAAE